MFFYILPYLFILFISLNLFYSRIKKIKFWYLLILILPALLVAVLRGNVGTDSFFYLGLFEDYRHYGESRARYEPGFEMLGKALMGIGLTPRAGVAMVAVLSTLLLCWAFSKTKNQMLLFALILFPLFYYDFTMNGIRYGLSFTLATVGIDSLYRKKYTAFAVWSLLALSMQYSAVLVFIPFVSVLIKKKYILAIAVLLGGVFLLFPEYFAFITDRISGKRDSYSQIYAPSITSGLAPLLVVAALYINYLWFNRGRKVSKVIHIIFLCEIASFVLAKFTYAGLRFQGAFMFAMIVFLKNNSEKIVKIKKYSGNLVLLSIMSILLFVKNITTVVEGELTPFLPYKFYWEEQFKDRL